MGCRSEQLEAGSWFRCRSGVDKPRKYTAWKQEGANDGKDGEQDYVSDVTEKKVVAEGVGEVTFSYSKALALTSVLREVGKEGLSSLRRAADPKSCGLSTHKYTNALHNYTFIFVRCSAEFNTLASSAISTSCSPLHSGVQLARSNTERQSIAQPAAAEHGLLLSPDPFLAFIFIDTSRSAASVSATSLC